MDIFGEVANCTFFRPGPAVHVLATTGMFDTAAKFSGSTADSLKRALKAGSSQPGNMVRASATSNCVTSMRRAGAAVVL